jgi:DNA-binding GntR family transcriptional regulator
VQASGNAALAATHQMLQVQSKRMRYIGNEEPGKWAGAVAEHEEMIAALVMRVADRLEELIGRHLDQTLARVGDTVP